VKRNLFSANFKKDYVAYSAIIIFFVIVVVELFMAICIPVHLQGEHVWAEQVSRQEMLDKFDFLRGRLHNFRGKDKRATGEGQIILNALNAFADYLRENQARMSQTQIVQCNECFNKLTSVAEKLAQKGAYSSKKTLDAKTYIEKLKVKLALITYEDPTQVK
jgi:hypothetical protein